MEEKTALLIVDVQNDFCPGGSLAVTEGDQVIPPLNEMIKHAKNKRWFIFASRDWHQKKTHHFKEYGGPWPEHCVQGTKGAEFHPAINLPNKTDKENYYIISKGTHPDEHGYSPLGDDAYVEFESVMASALGYLNVKNITTLYIGGLATDYCVKAAVLDACENGFKVKVLLDACRAVNLKPDDEEKAVQEMRTAGAIITTTKKILAQN